eukprot:3809406-Heterocapsa_arctica.AAC.1
MSGGSFQRESLRQDTSIETSGFGTLVANGYRGNRGIVIAVIAADPSPLYTRVSRWRIGPIPY